MSALTTTNSQFGSAVDLRQKLRVLQVFSVLGMGGAETWLMSLLKYFKDHGNELPVHVEFDILLTGTERGVFDDEAKALGARLFYIPFTRRTLPQFRRRFRQLLADNNYSAIHDHQDYIAGLHFLMAGKYLPRKRVVHVHNALLHLENYRRSRLRTVTSKSGKRLIRNFATDVLGTSVQLLEEYELTLQSLPDKHVGAAHCGFDVNRFRGDSTPARRKLLSEFNLPSKSKLLLFVGRLDSSLHPKLNAKNPSFAIDIAKLCIAQDPNCYLLMAGGGGEEIRSQLSRQIAASGLGDKILVLGMRSDVEQLMLASDLLLLPSLAEGLGMVAVEAQATGLRVLASDKTPRECVVLGELVAFKSLDDGPAAWADEVVRLLKLPRVNSIVANNAVKASPFSIENSARRLIEIYTAP